MQRRAVLAFALGVAVTSGCGQAGETSSAATTRDYPGATVVVNDEPAWATGDVWSVSAEPVVTIGRMDGPVGYQLSRVAAAARQSDGDVIVADRGTREVSLFDNYGGFVRRLGRPGSGPGEFTSPTDVLVTTGDSVIVWDNATYRLSRFDADGEFVGVHSVDLGALVGAMTPPLYPGAAQLVRDGEILVRLLEKAIKGGAKAGGGVEPGVSRPPSGAIRVAVDLSHIDTVMFFGDVERVTVRAPWGEWPTVPPLAKTTVTAAHATSSRVCVGEQEATEVVCFDADGSATVIRWTADPVPVTHMEVDRWHDTTMALLTQKLSDGDVRRILAEVPVPTVRPPYSRLVLDAAGYLWVERAPATAGAAVDYLVFDPAGTLLGSIFLPLIDVLEIGDDYVMGVRRDELDVEYLEVFALTRDAPAPPNSMETR